MASQSYMRRESPDIISMASSARQQSALTTAIINEIASPLAQACDHTIDIKAGVEMSVAATKTFVTSAVAGLALLAHWSKNAELIDAIDALPDIFAQAVTIDWPHMRASLKDQDSLYVLGLGPSLAMANEAALKFKETCRVHAESHSSAEVLHGPVSIIGDGYPVLAPAARDATESSIVSVADQLAADGALVFITSKMANSAQRLECAPTGHPLAEPLALIVSFYSFIEKLAQDRGLNPDQPRNLKKVTETL